MTKLLNFIWCLIVLAGVYEECQSACQEKSAGPGVKQSDLAGKYYLISLKPSFPYQSNQLRCGVATVDGDPNKSPFKYVVSYQKDDGSTKSIDLTMNSVSTGVQDTTVPYDGAESKFKLITIGTTSPPDAHVFFACNKDDYAVWVYYKKRVNGFDAIDTNIKAQLQSILKKNNIQMSDLQTVKNDGCTN